MQQRQSRRAREGPRQGKPRAANSGSVRQIGTAGESLSIFNYSLFFPPVNSLDIPQHSESIDLVAEMRQTRQMFKYALLQERQNDTKHYYRLERQAAGRGVR